MIAVKNYIEINGKRLPLDLMDAGFAQRLEAAHPALQAAYAAADEIHTENGRALMDAKIRAVCAFFDAVFGKGTALQTFNYTNEVAPYIHSTMPPGRSVGSLRSVLEGK